MSGTHFSTLEAVSPEYEPLWNDHGDEGGKQVLSEELSEAPGKYAVPVDNVVSRYTDAVDATPQHGYQQHDSDEKNCQTGGFQASPEYGQRQPWGKRKWHWVGIGVALVVVLAAVLGGVLGSRKRSQSSTASSSSSSSTSNSTLVSNATTASRKIDAISFPSDKVNHTRVFYQQIDGTLVEAVSSDTDTYWTFRNIEQLTLNSSAIAAAVSRPNFTLELTVLYTDTKYIIHDYVFNVSTNTWAEGNISGEGYKTHPHSTLAIMYNQCDLCANTTIIAYQDVNGFIQVANHTSSGWSLTQLNTDNIIGTGLALYPFYRINQSDKIDLFHQTSTLNISLATWTADQAAKAGTGWVDAVQVYDIATANTPLAAASSYSTVATGFPSWVQILQVSDTGIEANAWEGSTNNWLERGNHPSVMANSSANVKTYGSIAVTATGAAFGVVQVDGENTIERWQVENNLLGWTPTGTVISWT